MMYHVWIAFPFVYAVNTFVLAPLVMHCLLLLAMGIYPPRHAIIDSGLICRS